MKIYIRYLVQTTALKFFFLLCALLSLWVVYDLVGMLNDFLQAGVSFYEILMFYIYQLPGALPMFLPVATLLAVAFTVYHLRKNGELIALLSSGVDPKEICTPFLFLGLSFAVCQLVLENSYAPKSIRSRGEHIEEYRARVRNREPQLGPKLKTVVFYNENKERIWFVRKADASKQEITDVEILQMDRRGNDVWKIFARKMKYSQQTGWKATEGVKVFYSGEGSPSSYTINVTDTHIKELDETFTMVAAAVFSPEMLTNTELRNFLENNPKLPRHRLSHYLAVYYRQLWSFAPCLGAVLLVLGFCMKASLRRELRGFGLPTAIYISYSILEKIFLEIAKSGRLSVEMLVSIPHVLWLACGVFFFRTMLRF